MRYGQNTREKVIGGRDGWFEGQEMGELEDNGG